MSRRHLVATLRATEHLPQPRAASLRLPTAEDAEALAELMLDAYRGTIDFSGDETLDVAREELGGYLAGKSGEPMLEHSRVAVERGRLVSAALVSCFEGLPLIAYVFTAADRKGRGLADALTQHVMASLAADGYESVHLWVTAGNIGAERIYERLEFRDVERG